MNKITSTLAGLALVATASVVPAMAQGTFTYSGGPAPFTFSTDGPGMALTATNVAVQFNPTVGAVSNGFLTLSGGTFLFGGPVAGTITGVTEAFSATLNGPVTITDTGTVFISQRSATTFDIASDTTTYTRSGTSFDLVPGSPVPEASTVVSFGALLALGGLAVVLRRKGVKNAA